MRLGLFGGTFDPPHLGHLILAEAARDQLRLDRVLWIVAGQSPLKLERELSSPEIRVAMVQAAIADNAHFALSHVDLDRPGPHYTVDTLALLETEFPEAEFCFLMGEDSLRDLPRWKDPGTLIRKAWLGVLARPGVEFDFGQLESAVPGVAGRVRWVNAPQLEIASSDIQQRVREGRSVRYMLPPEVMAIVQGLRLYGSAG